ncbi:growth/differentiation factor 8 [Parasteatoda tepidariorum]|uniref:growth/differentiation factor 8 n=1 Tax=Parasteatoda tepidariorum TaxID=114398 RepID=UPI00077FE43D|nr:growth/differentiation factor 8 [Parasteatoda tepidariorum]
MSASFWIIQWLLLFSHVLFFFSGGVSGNTLQHVSSDEEAEQLLSEDFANCSRCGDKQERKAIRLEAIKSQILSQLGMTEAPNVTLKNLPHIPPLDNLLDHYSMQADSPAAFVPGPEYGEDEDFYIAAEKVLTFSKPLPAVPIGEVGDQQLFFHLPLSLKHAQIQSAQLWIYLRQTRHHPLPLNITLYQMENNSELIQLKRKTFDRKSKHGHWIVFDVKKVINHWSKHQVADVGFLLHATGLDMADLMRVSDESGAQTGKKQPFIETKIEKQRTRRLKRMIGLNCEENADEVRCCRYPLTVDFEEFGWDWIIAPKRYEANYCSGECPYVFLQKYPHTHLVQQANPQGSAGPCCAPRKMSSISMLYFDSDFNIIYGMLPGMVVDRCGCS